MTIVSELQKVNLVLSKAEYAELRRWLLEQDWERWDRQIEEDVRIGKLDA